MTDNLEAIIGAVGIVIFVIVFIAGLQLVQDASDKEPPPSEAPPR